MKYLSGLDNLFLNQESETQFMHVGGLGIYNPSTAKGRFVRFKDILEFFTERMSTAPVFRRRLTHSIFDTGRPFWVDDPNVDVEYHVRHMALPEPGDWRQLMIQIARIHSRPLDLTKPLWEAYIIEGLDNIPGLPKGGFALYIKFHHSAVDGEAAAHLVGNLHTLEANYTRDPDRAAIKTERAPQAAEIISRAAARRLGQIKGLKDLGVSLGSYAVRVASRGSLKSVLEKNGDIKELISSTFKPKTKRPETRFNQPVSSHRVLDMVEISLADCSTIRKQAGRGTINDIFLTVVGGAMRDYLKDKGESPVGSLMGTMPMTLRGENKSGDVGNQIAQTYYDLRSDVMDPVERLLAVNDEITALKTELDAGLGKDFQSRLLELLPAAIIAKPLTRSLGENANVNISNVRGPNLQLYMAGARLERFIPFSIVTDGCGLNITSFSYNGIMAVAVTCCREMMPDPERFCKFLKASFEELKLAAASINGAASLDESADTKPSKTNRKNKISKKKRVKKRSSTKVTAKASTSSATPRSKKKASRKTAKRTK